MEEQVRLIKDRIKYDKLPVHMRETVRDYVEKGTPPGDFMRFALENKLVEAAGHADDINRRSLEHWAWWLSWECPAKAWRSAANVDAWIEMGGLDGFGK